MASSNPNDVEASDEIQDMYCEQCKLHDATEVPASGFCVDCKDYLCSTCLTYDKRTYFQHTHLDKDKMPQDFCFEKCSTHTDMLIKFYCANCDELACTICKINHHNKCVEIHHLPQVVENVEKGSELKQLNEAINEVSEDLEETTRKLDENINQISLQEEEATYVISNYKDKMTKAFIEKEQAITTYFEDRKKKIIERLMKDKEEEIGKLLRQKHKVEEDLEKITVETLMRVTETKTHDSDRLQICSQKQKLLKNEVERIKIDIEQKTEICQRTQLFVAIKKYKRFVHQLKKDLQDINDQSEIRRYFIQIKTDATKRNLRFCNEFFCYTEKSEHKKLATFEYKITTNRKDNKPISCTSLCIPSENQLLITDYENNAIVFFRDLQDNKDSFIQLKTSAGPWDMTKINDITVAVTFPDQGAVKLLKISKMKPKGFSTFKPFLGSKSDEIIDEIKVGKSCCGIAFRGGNLFISYTNPPKVQEMDMLGNNLKTFDKDCHNKPLFTSPIHIAIDSQNLVMYVSDFEENTITSMDLKGQVKSVLKPSSLLQPTQIAIDESGTPYICGHKSENIHILSTKKQEMDILMEISHGILQPTSLAYCTASNRLFVGMTTMQAIKVFKISTDD